jgi:8-oxoguanine deaminase
MRIWIKDPLAIFAADSERGVVVEGTRIAERVGRGQTPERIDATYDASRAVVLPGLVNAHHHFYQTLTRAHPQAINKKLFPWLVALYPIWSRLKPAHLRVAVRMALTELLLSGCTTAADHHYLYPAGLEDAVDIAVEEALRLGVRMTVSRGSMNLSAKDGGLPPDSVVQDEETILIDSERVIKEFHDPSPRAMRKVVLAPCSPFSVTENLMLQSARLARAHGVRLHTHLAETSDEEEYCISRHGLRPLELMDKCEFIGPDVFFAHGIFFNDAELDTLRARGAHIAHCPSSNMRLGSGICRVREMLDRGIHVSLAVDGSASNDSSDFLGEMRQALLLQRVARGSSALGARDVLRMATDAGAAALGFEGIGRIQEGYAADIAVFNVDRLEYCGSLSDPFAALIFAGYDHGTEYTICNGNVVVDKGRLTGIEEETLVKEANRISARLIAD